MGVESSGDVPGIGGYVLAGGRSSRMGRDKALLELAGAPLIAHAVAKLRRIASEVHILAGEAPGNAALAEFAPLVFDRHPDCGPAAGIDAALVHSRFDWNLILPVDLPFLPSAFLFHWVQSRPRVLVSLFRVSAVLQPTLLLVHRKVGPLLGDALARREYKLYPILENAAGELAPASATAPAGVPFVLSLEDYLASNDWEAPPRAASAWQTLTPAQRAAQARWFANLNTPAEFAEAERHVDALDALF